MTMVIRLPESGLACAHPGCTYVLTPEKAEKGATGLHRFVDGGDLCRGSYELCERFEASQKPEVLT